MSVRAKEINRTCRTDPGIYRSGKFSIRMLSRLQISFQQQCKYIKYIGLYKDFNSSQNDPLTYSLNISLIHLLIIVSHMIRTLLPSLCRRSSRSIAGANTWQVTST